MTRLSEEPGEPDEPITAIGWITLIVVVIVALLASWYLLSADLGAGGWAV